MKAVYTAIPGPAGHGLIRLTGLDGPVETEGLAFSLKRASDHRILGLAGWQESECPLRPRSLSADEAGLSLQVGPEVADHLDMRETYRLFLHGPGRETAAGSLVIESISYSPLAGGQSLGLTPTQPETPKQQQPAAAVEPARAAEAASASPPAQEEPAPDRRPGRPLGLKLMLAALMLAVVGGLLFFKGAGMEVEVQEADPPATGGMPPTAEAAALDRARQHLAGTADPVAGLALAREVRDQPGGADAAFLLIEDAAQKGLAEAFIPLAEYYDPLTENQGSIVKDAPLAGRWYQEAAKAKMPGAAEKLAALLAWAESGPGRGTLGGEELLKSRP